jgi:hypothetical protein
MRWPCIRLAGIACVGGLVAACAATYTAGEDPKGVKLKSEASEVLVAVRKFAARHRYYPRSAAEMVPEFLAAAPEVEMRISPSYAYGLAFFEYGLPWPSGRVSCRSFIEVTKWVCTEYK